METSKDKIARLYAEMEKHPPQSEESKRYAEQILEAIFDVEPEAPKTGSTYHDPGCPCGFCKMGSTRF